MQNRLTERYIPLRSEIEAVPEFVEEDCDPAVAEAARRFWVHWKRRKTKRSVPKILREIVWPAWRVYLRSVPPYLRKLCKGLDVNPLNDPGGRIKAIVRNAREGIYLCRPEDGLHFQPTIGTLRFMLEECESFERRKARGTNRQGLFVRRTGVCTWKKQFTIKCCEMTEYLAYLRGADIGIGSEEMLIKPLNERRCVLHANRSGASRRSQTIRNQIIKLNKRQRKFLERLKLKDAENLFDPKPKAGKGLCRMCGRLTERDAVRDLFHSGKGFATVRKKWKALSESFCCHHAGSSTKYHAALLALDKYDDTRSRLQRQSHHGGELKSIHSNPAVNWFENRLVNELHIRSTQNVGARVGARLEAIRLIGNCSEALLAHEIESEIKVLADRLIRQAKLFDDKTRSHLVWAALKKLHRSDQALFQSISVYALYSEGFDQRQIAKTLGRDRIFVSRQLRELFLNVLPDPDEVNLSMAADYLTREARTTEGQMSIMFWKSHGLNLVRIGKNLRISPQAVSKALGKVPKCLRFDSHRPPLTRDGKAAQFNSPRTLRFNANGKLERRARIKQQSFA